MKTLIVDDHPLYREGLANLLQQIFPDACVEQAGDVHTALDVLARGGGTDLILLDLKLPGLDGRTALPDLRRLYPAVPVVIVSAEDDTATIRACIDAGASGYIPKAARREVLAAALTVVADGGVYLPPALRQLSSAPATMAWTPHTPPLTQREREVLAGVCAGEANKVIARRLDISEATVRAHLGSVFRALGVANRTQAALVARQLGILDGKSDSST